MNNKHLESLCAHMGAGPDPQTGGMSQAIQLATTFARNADGTSEHGYGYARYGNPNRDALEAAVAKLEGGAEGFAFASGVAAAMAVFMTLRPSDEVLLHQDVYAGVRHQLRDVLAPWGLQARYIDMRDVVSVEASISEATKLIWIETPSNPLLELIDLGAVAALAKKRGVLTVCDNTFCTPLWQRPLQHGFDLVMHSSTKYFGGHSDVLGGILVAAKASEVSERIRMLQHKGGAVPSPFDCWLVMRGLRSLPARMGLHGQNALAVAQFLERQPGVERVRYAGLESHPQHALAKQQMTGFGGVVSFQIKGGTAEARRVVDACQFLACATSLGGTETLIEHRRTAEGEESATPENLIRMSVGLEHPNDICADLAQALKIIA